MAGRRRRLLDLFATITPGRFCRNEQKGQPAWLPFLLLHWEEMSHSRRRRGWMAGALILAGVLAVSGAARAQSGPPDGARTGADAGPAQGSPSTMTGADAELVQAQRRAIAEEAAFFGYDLSLPGWTPSARPCPEMPAYLLLHYRRITRRGARSIFTALVPREGGRVYVVPVLYGNATPYKRAVGSERSLAVFNRAIPATVVKQALNPNGSWLELGVCYAEMVGGGPDVLTNSSGDAGGPSPTLQVSEADGTRAVVFTEQDGPGRYRVWTVNFSGQGRAVSATAVSGSSDAGREINGTMPKEEPLPPAARPKETVLRPSSEPRPQPLPQ